MTGGLACPVPPARKHIWGLALTIFVLAAVPRLAVVESGPLAPAPDTTTYVQPAKNLAAGRGYVDDLGKPYSFRPPTYPLFLAAIFSVTGESLAAVQVVQALLAAAGAAALACWVARRHGVGAGTAAGILLGLDPILIPVPAFVLTEALGTLLVPAILVCLDQGLSTRRGRYFLLAGVLGGAAALNTPITLLLVPWLLLTAWLLRSPRRPDWRTWVLTLGLTAACLGLWTTRNYLVKGEAVVVRDNGFGALVWATTEYEFDWIPNDLDPGGWTELLRKYNALSDGRTDSQAHTAFLHEAWRNFQDRPLVVLKRVVKANFWFWIEAPGSHLKGELRPFRWVTLVFHQFQLLALFVALWSLWRASQVRRWDLWISPMVYFAVFLSLMMPIPRYYVPILPVVDTLIGAGLALLVAPGKRVPGPGAQAKPIGR